MPPGVTRAPQSRMSDACRRVAVRAVDVQHRRSAPTTSSCAASLNSRTCVHPIGDAGRGEVGVEGLVVVGGLGCEAARSPAGRDRCPHVDRWRRPRRRRARRRPARWCCARGSCRSRRSGHRHVVAAAASYSRSRLVGRHPAVDAVDRASSRSRRTGVRAHATYTPKPNTDDPDQAEHLQRAVGGEDLLRRGAVALLEDQRVAQQGGRHRHDRQLVERPRRAGELLGVERPDAVRHQRCTAADRQHDAQEPERVVVERACVSARRRRARAARAYRLPVTMNSEANEVVSKNHVLIGTSVATAPPIARSTKPAATATRSTTAMCFSTALYNDGQDDVAGDHDGRLPPRGRGEADAGHEQHRADDPCEAERDRATGDRPVLLRRMVAIVLDDRGCRSRSRCRCWPGRTRRTSPTARHSVRAVVEHAGGTRARRSTSTFLTHCFGRASSNRARAGHPADHARRHVRDRSTPLTHTRWSARSSSSRSPALSPYAHTSASTDAARSSSHRSQPRAASPRPGSCGPSSRSRVPIAVDRCRRRCTARRRRPSAAASGRGTTPARPTRAPCDDPMR